MKNPLDTKSDNLAAYQHEFNHSLVDFSKGQTCHRFGGNMFQCYGQWPSWYPICNKSSLQLRNTGKIGDLQKIPCQALSKAKMSKPLGFCWDDIELLFVTLVFSLMILVAWGPGTGNVSSAGRRKPDSYELPFRVSEGIPEMKAKLGWKACHVAAFFWELWTMCLLNFVESSCGNTQPEFHAQQQSCFRTLRHCTTQERPQQCSCLVRMAQHNKLWLLAMTEMFGTKGLSPLLWSFVYLIWVLPWHLLE